jgi:hypothetical protein
MYASTTTGGSDSYVSASVKKNLPLISSYHIYVKGEGHLKTGHEGQEGE